MSAFEEVVGGTIDYIDAEAELDQSRALIDAERGRSTLGKRTPKRAREWIWRPMEDDILAIHEATEFVGDVLESLDFENRSMTQ